MGNTWLEISGTAIRNNIAAFRSLIPAGTALAAVVKSNAYGHDIRLVTRIAVEAGVDVIAVNSAEEAMLVNSLFPKVRVLVMGVIPPDNPGLPDLNSTNIMILSSDKELMAKLAETAPEAEIHIKTDTGMGRLGLHPEELAATLSFLKSKKIKPAGIATHFASTEDFTEHSYSMSQLKLFHECIKIAADKGFKKLTRHCAASASTMLFPEAHMDMVRIGISLYGLWPSIQTRLSLTILGKDISLQPALSWKTRIVHINDLPAGSFIGYGSTYKTTHPSRIAVIPVGYFEGLDRKLSNNGYFLVRGERARIVGRVCMNMTMIDVTNIAGVGTGDEVVLIGRSEDETITADDIASWTGTINYEVVTGIHESIPKIETP